MHGMTSALLAACLSAQGLPGHYWCTPGGSVAIADDLGNLVRAELNLNAGSLAAAIEYPREAAELFERSAGRCGGILQQHLVSLHAHGRRELAL